MATLKVLCSSAGRSVTPVAGDTVVLGGGVTTPSGNLTISPAGSDILVGANKNIVSVSGTGAFDLSAGSGIFKTTTGAVTIGPGTTTISGQTTFSSAANPAVTVTNNMVVSGTFNPNGGVERSTAGTLVVGNTGNVTAITLGRSGITTTMPGNLLTQGTLTVVSTFTTQGAAVIGDGTDDTLSVIGRVISDLNFRNDANRSILADAKAAGGGATGVQLTFSGGPGGTGAAGSSPTHSGVGGKATVNGAAGGAGVGTSSVGQTAADAGVGGASELIGGVGGAGSSGGSVDNANAGAGGSAVVRGGAGGTAGSGTGSPTGGAGGSAVVDGGVATGGLTNGDVQIGQTNASAIGIGRSGITTTITGGLTQLTGVVSLTGNGASQISTSSGTLTLSGAGGVILQGSGTSALVVNSSGTAVTVQAGATLVTTGTGNIDLPNNGSARFKIEGSAVGSTVTAANLGTLTNAGDATALHFHNKTLDIYTAGAGGVSEGDVVYPSANNTVLKAQANAISTIKGVVGVAAANISAAAQGNITTAGKQRIRFVAGLTLAAGDEVYVSAATAGRATNVAPSSAGQFLKFLGIVKDASAYAGSDGDFADVQLQLGARAEAVAA